MSIDEVRNDLLRELLAEFLIMEAQLSKITGDNFTEEDANGN